MGRAAPLLLQGGIGADRWGRGLLQLAGTGACRKPFEPGPASAGPGWSQKASSM
jgi:hypothetical protein